MKLLFILNDPPYGTEKNYNALRLAASVAKQDETEVLVFLIGDGASCAKKGQRVPKGYYNLEVMLQNVKRSGGKIGVCGTCIEARGITEPELMEGAEKSTLGELTKWTIEADKVLTF